MKTLISVSGVTATIVAGIGLFVTYSQNNERLVTERFSKAVEQLGSDKIETRLGGIYALERISKDSDRDYWTVMEVLTAFVREHAKITEKQTTSSSKKITGKQVSSTQTPTTEEQAPSLATDIQAVLTIIQRRKLSFGDGEDNPLNLGKANLHNANLHNANLQRIFLWNANLQRAYLEKANLQRANLSNANLRGAILWNANLQGAILRNANLQGAILWNTNLQGAILGDVNLQKAQYTDNSTTPEKCNRYFKKYPCPTIFPPNFDPKAAGMILVK